MRTQTTQLKRQKNNKKTRDHHSVRTEGNLGTSMRAETSRQFLLKYADYLTGLRSGQNEISDIRPSISVKENKVFSV
jgi:hypothetical protein